MNIAMIFDGLGIGGIERVGVDYIRMLHENGHEITVYNLHPAANEMEKEIQKFAKIRHKKFPRAICPDKYSRLEKKWVWGKFLYYPAFATFSLVQGLLRLFLRDTTKQFDVAIAFSSHFNDLTFLVNDYLKSKEKACWLHGGIQDYVESATGYMRLYKQIANLVTLSSKGEEELLAKYALLTKIRTTKIYNPSYVKTRELNLSLIQELQEKYGEYLLMVGRFTKEKDHKTVIEALHILKSKYNKTYKLLFVGDGPTKAQMEQYALDMGVQEQVIFVGSRQDVQNYYAAATLYVHASPSEGLPTVLIEALYFELPIVATNSLPGVSEILQEGKCGMICEIGNSVEMAEYINRLFEEETLYEHFVSEGRKRVNDFAPETIQRQLEGFLEQLSDGE
jgi:Glycosyltransferase